LANAPRIRGPCRALEGELHPQLHAGLPFDLKNLTRETSPVWGAERMRDSIWAARIERIRAIARDADLIAWLTQPVANVVSAIVRRELADLRHRMGRRRLGTGRFLQDDQLPEDCRAALVPDIETRLSRRLKRSQKKVQRIAQKPPAQWQAWLRRAPRR